MAVATRMPVEELGVALAMHCKLFDIPARQAHKELDQTQRIHFDEGCRWANANGNVIRLIKEDPQIIAAGGYSLSEGRSWLSRLLGLGRSKDAAPPADDEIERMAKQLRKKRPKQDAARARRLAELSELVDESFGSA